MIEFGSLPHWLQHDASPLPSYSPASTNDDPPLVITNHQQITHSPSLKHLFETTTQSLPSYQPLLNIVNQLHTNSYHSINWRFVVFPQPPRQGAPQLGPARSPRKAPQLHRAVHASLRPDWWLIINATSTVNWLKQMAQGWLKMITLVVTDRGQFRGQLDDGPTDGWTGGWTGDWTPG